MADVTKTKNSAQFWRDILFVWSTAGHQTTCTELCVTTYVLSAVGVHIAATYALGHETKNSEPIPALKQGSKPRYHNLNFVVD